MFFTNSLRYKLHDINACVPPFVHYRVLKFAIYY